MQVCTDFEANNFDKLIYENHFVNKTLHLQLKANNLACTHILLRLLLKHRFFFLLTRQNVRALGSELQQNVGKKSAQS